MRLSIITVTLNAAERVDSTAASLVSLSAESIEWLVVDGASGDGTVVRIEAWRPRLKCVLRVISEPDRGLYDAMNKGLLLAKGEWVWFLNAGDTLCEPHRLQSMLEDVTPSDCLVTGKVRLIDPHDGYRIVVGDPFSWGRVAFGAIPPHPSCFYRRTTVVDVGGYEPKVAGIAADTLLTLHLAAIGGTRFVDVAIAEFAMDGISSRFDWRWRVHRDKARAIKAAAPAWVWRRYRWLWPVEALRATASHLLRKVGLLGLWRRIKGGR